MLDQFTRELSALVEKYDREISPIQLYGALLSVILIVDKNQERK